MTFYGLHIVDLLIVVVFVVAVLGAGIWASRSVKHQGDYYLGGRKLGKTLQFFLSFGNMTDTTGAALTVGQVYRLGIGGVWYGLQTLFITPFFWFMPVWFRRARLVTMADLFVDRFNSHVLSTAYVLFGILVAFLSLGMGGVISYKVVAALMTKPAASWTAAEKQSIESFHEYKKLQKQYEAGSLSPASKARLDELDTLVASGEVKSFISYVRPTPFFVSYMLLAGIYIILGGFKAAAISDAIEGTLILLFTVGMIVLGLVKVGGFSGLHASVPAHSFELFGTAGGSNLAWYTVIAITFTSLVQIFGLAPNMANAGSAENESAARFGMITGAYSKRAVTVVWGFCGLIALSLLGGTLSDPDNTWGFLSTALLVPGLMGLMLAAMVVGRMANVGANSLTISALIVRNIYEPLVKNRSPEHYVFMGKIVIVIVLAIGIFIGLFFSFTRVDTLYTTLVTLNAFYGAVVLLTFFWRKLTAAAIGCSLVVWVTLMAVVPWVLPQFESFRQSEALLRRTLEQTEEVTAAAAADDVTAGRATKAGESITKARVVRPTPLFFESIARAERSETTLVQEGRGRFQVEIYLLDKAGVPVEKMSRAGLIACQWAVSGVLPFVMLIPLSYVTARRRTHASLAVARSTTARSTVGGSNTGVAVVTGDEVGDSTIEVSDADSQQFRIDCFYARLKTPVAGTPEDDQHEVALSNANPHRFDHLKLFPRSNWEFTRWTRGDFVGFFGCCVVAVAILGVLWMLLNIGA